MKIVELAVQGKHEPYVLVKPANPQLQLKVYTRYDVDAKRTILSKAQVFQEKQPTELQSVYVHDLCKVQQFPASDNAYSFDEIQKLVAKKQEELEAAKALASAGDSLAAAQALEEPVEEQAEPQPEQSSDEDDEQPIFLPSELQKLEEEKKKKKGKGKGRGRKGRLARGLVTAPAPKRQLLMQPPGVSPARKRQRLDATSHVTGAVSDAVETRASGRASV
eukprot:5211655-Amphidinium_carterae.1